MLQDHEAKTTPAKGVVFLDGNTIIGNQICFKRDEKVYLTPHYSRRLFARAAGRCHLGSYQ